MQLDLGTRTGHDNLHSLWDSAMASHPNLERPLSSESKRWLDEYSNKLIAAYPPENYTKKLATSYSSWLSEGLIIVKDYVYQGIQENNAPRKEYLDKNLSIVEQQLALAGYRLANELNCVYDTASCVKT